MLYFFVKILNVNRVIRVLSALIEQLSQKFNKVNSLIGIGTKQNPPLIKIKDGKKIAMKKKNYH